LLVEDMEAAEKLYAGTLGMEVLERLPLGDAGEALFINAGAVKLELIPKAAFEGEERLGVPGEERFLGKGVSYYAKRDFKQVAGKTVLVIGGGNTTAKSALVAKGEASSVMLAHRRESLRAYPLMVKRLQKEGIEIWYNTEVKEIKGDDKVECAIVVNNKTGGEREIAVDWIVICVGTEPDTNLAREAGIEMAGGFVKVDDLMMTNKAGIFACGEITGADRHLISATAEGASAGMAASEYLALEKVRKGEMFEGAINGKYADEYLTMLG